MIYALVDKNKNLLDDFTSKLGLRIDEYISDCCINDELTKKLSNKDVLIIENVLALGGYVEEIVNTISRLSSLDIDLYLIKEDLHIKAILANVVVVGALFYYGASDDVVFHASFVILLIAFVRCLMTN